jgi:hypothetical protein
VDDADAKNVVAEEKGRTLSTMKPEFGRGWCSRLRSSSAHYVIDLAKTLAYLRVAGIVKIGIARE